MAYHVFFDVALREHDEAVGRMIFEIDDDLPTKKSLDNFRALVTGERAALDPSLRYKESTFETGSAYTNGGTYKWSHVCKGRGKNIFGKEKIEEVGTLQACKQNPGGMGAGAYYGIDVGTVLDEWLPDDDEVTQRLTVQLQKPLGLILEESDLGGCFIAELLEGGAAEKGGVLMAGDSIESANAFDCRGEELDEVLEVFADAGSTINLVVTREVPPGIRRDGSGLTLLTLPIGSPGCGQSRFDIVRVGDSPNAWGTRLLANSLVIGRMVSGQPCIDEMASGQGTPQIVNCGILASESG